MPLVTSSYRPPFGFGNAHVQTIFAALFRRVATPPYARERIDTPDGDFLDIDWARTGAPRAAILSHGLEGSARRSYVRGMARALHRAGWDVAAWNFRGCSGGPNQLPRFYHSGATDDLDVVVQHVLEQGYERVVLVGFSLGGNLTLKYVGERGPAVDDRLTHAVALSVPCDLAAASDELAKPHNTLYARRFLRHLRAKVRAKAARYPDHFDLEGLRDVPTLRAFDDRYTAPLHGFTDAADYYAQANSRQFLPAIRIPTLLLSAADDPFLPASCYPVDLARRHAHLHLDVPRQGGHVGFVARSDRFWSEQRAVAFVAQDDAV